MSSTNGSHVADDVFQHYHLLAYVKVDPRRVPLEVDDRRHLVTWLKQLAYDLEKHHEEPSALYGLGADGEAT